MNGSDNPLASEMTGLAVKVMINAISPTLMPTDAVDSDQILPTSLFIDLFGAEEEWQIRGQEVGSALLRVNNLRRTLNTERAVRVVLQWLRDNHPGAEEVAIEHADHRQIDVVVRLDYPHEFLRGIMLRVAWGTGGRDAIAVDDKPYHFRVTL
jgi:hypothetical protein